MSKKKGFLALVLTMVLAISGVGFGRVTVYASDLPYSPVTVENIQGEWLFIDYAMHYRLVFNGNVGSFYTYGSFGTVRATWGHGNFTITGDTVTIYGSPGGTFRRTMRMENPNTPNARLVGFRGVAGVRQYYDRTSTVPNQPSRATQFYPNSNIPTFGSFVGLTYDRMSSHAPVGIPTTFWHYVLPDNITYDDYTRFIEELTRNHGFIIRDLPISNVGFAMTSLVGTDSRILIMSVNFQNPSPLSGKNEIVIGISYTTPNQLTQPPQTSQAPPITTTPTTPPRNDGYVWDERIGSFVPPNWGQVTPMPDFGGTSGTNNSNVTSNTTILQFYPNTNIPTFGYFIGISHHSVIENGVHKYILPDNITERDFRRYLIHLTLHHGFSLSDVRLGGNTRANFSLSSPMRGEDIMLSFMRNNNTHLIASYVKNVNDNDIVLISIDTW